MLTVRALITSKAQAFNSVPSGMLVFDALGLMNSLNLSYLVVKDGDEFRGIFCERDYSRKVILKGKSSKNSTVGEIMSTDLPKVALTDTLEHCMNTMISQKARYLLAYEDTQFVSVITIHDLLRAVISNREAVFDQSVVNKLIRAHETASIS